MRAIQSVRINLILNDPKAAVLTRGLFLRNGAPISQTRLNNSGYSQQFRGNLDNYLPVNTSGVNGPNGMSKNCKGR